MAETNATGMEASPPPRVRVAIDGPAGVGKTTSARALAARLGYLYLDTGAMYRALALAAARGRISVDDVAGSEDLAQVTAVTLTPDAEGGVRVLLDGLDVTASIRTPEVSDGASRISVHRGVRERMVSLQQAMAAGGGVVMEGRDIGTRVMPDAEVKIYLTALPEERARRRHREMIVRGESVPFEAVLEQIRERDARDTEREVDPLRPAPDAIQIDGTNLSLNEQVDAIEAAVRRAQRELSDAGETDSQERRLS
ncbi:MAG: cytidylate kinase [bacterium]|nr:MAG: cytidylate kinase [bacterium]